MKKVLFVSLMCLVAVQVLIGQSVGINTTTPDKSAALDIESDSMGILIPRMKTSQRIGIISPGLGLMVFDTETNSFWYYVNEWIEISEGDASILLKKGFTTSAMLGDTAAYFLGELSIGKDTSVAQLDVYTEKSAGLFVHSKSKNEASPVGIEVIMENEDAFQQAGMIMNLAGEQIYKYGSVIQSQFNDSLTNTVFGRSATLNFSGSITDSLERKLYGLYNNLSGSDNIYQVGVYNRISGSSYGGHLGTFNEMLGHGNGEQIGTYNKFTIGSGFGERYGTKNEMTGRGSLFGTYQNFNSMSDSTIYGLYNKMDNLYHDGIKYAVYNLMENSATFSEQYAIRNHIKGTYNYGNHYAISNILEAAGSGDRFGIDNSILGTGEGSQFGVNTLISVSGNGTHYGNNIILNGSGTGQHYGNKLKLEGTGTGIQYGNYIEISNSGPKVHYGTFNQLTGSGIGIQFGTYQQITVSGDGNHFGNYNAINGTGSGVMYGTYNTIYSSGSGTHYGSYNRIVDIGTGTHIAGFFEAFGTGTNRYAAVFNTGQVVANESGGDNDFRIESADNENMFFVDGNMNRIGIGTNLPTRELDIKGAVVIQKNSSILDAQLDIVEEGADFARLNMSNDQESSFWTIAARPRADSTLARFNFYSSQIGNVLSLEGDGDAVVLNKLAVGTSAPLATLHVNAKGDFDPIRIQNNNNTKFRILSNNGVVLGANWDNAMSNVFRVHMDHVFIGFDGNHVPEAKLEVDGAITIGHTTANVQAGSLRFNNATNTFEGFDGTSWRAMVQENDVQIGDLAFGGIVFWVDPSGQHGLVCATTDQSIGVRWWAGSAGETQSLGVGIYAGKMNTSIIISSQVAIGDDQLPFAAKMCSELNTGGYGDWYLPSELELFWMYNNLHLAGLGGFENQYYWSSKEDSDTIAKGRSFSSGNATTSAKWNLARVRAIRSF